MENKCPLHRTMTTVLKKQPENLSGYYEKHQRFLHSVFIHMYIHKHTHMHKLASSAAWNYLPLSVRISETTEER